MATIHLSEAEYEALRGAPEAPTPWIRRIPLWGLALGGLSWAALMQQYVFLVLVGLVASLVLFVVRVMMPRLERAQLRWPFVLGPFELEIGPDGYVLREGADTLHLSAEDLDHVTADPRYYVLAHHSGSRVVVPRSVLTDEEIAHLDAFHRAHPWPDPRMPPS
jgi:hypothetical protein